MNKEVSGWIATAILALIGALKLGWDYLKIRDNNATKIKINEQNIERNQIAELEAQNKMLIEGLKEVEESLTAAKQKMEEIYLAFEIIFPIMNKMVEDNPTYKPVFENAFKHFKK